MDEAYELALATEGDGAAAYTDDQWIAWEEALALAPDLAAKKRLVHGTFGSTTPDFHFRAAICTLLEVQELLDEGKRESDVQADVVMKKEKDALLTGERELRAKRFWRKAKRVTHRRVLLELEIATRMGQSDAKIKELTREVATAMDLPLSDPAPLNVDVKVQATVPAKAALSEDKTSTEMKVLNALRRLQYCDKEHNFKDMARSDLNSMEPYAREVYFAYVVGEKDVWGRSITSSAKDLLSGVFGKKGATDAPIGSVGLTSAQCWWIFELFLDEFEFEYADIQGYLDVIVEDLKRTAKDVKPFGSRRAHSRLSLPQLQLLLEQESKLFRDDDAFVMRYIYFLRAAQEIEQESELDLRDTVQRERKLSACETYLSALSAFSASANTFRAWILHEQIRELQYCEMAMGELKAKFFQYIALPRFGTEIANASYVRKAKAEELVVFEEPAYSFRSSDHTKPTTALRVNHISCALGDHQVTAADDVDLIKAVLSVLWSGEQLTNDDEASVRTYLNVDFVDAHKAECMVVSGRGDLALWKPKLPRKGDELLEWSSKTEISFCESNPSYFSPEDEMEIFVNVRNVKTLTVQVFEVRTIDYYTRLRSEVQGDICLDGLLPNEEQQLDLSHLLPWQKARIPVKVSPTAAAGRRGVFVVEVFERDTTCRAILRKGYLRHVQRVTSRGVEFTVLDERGTILHDASLMVMNLKGGVSKAQAPRSYAAIDGSGVIVVPFREPGTSTMDKFGIVFRHGDYGYLHRDFDYTEASYSLQAQMFIDHEQLRPGEDATLLVRPVLFVGSGVKHTISVEMLTDIKVTFQFATATSDTTGTAGPKTVQSFASVVDLSEGRCKFTIPLDAGAVRVDILARVRADDSARELKDTHTLPSVTASDSFDVQRVTQYQDTFTPHFLRREAQASTSGSVPQYEYFIMVLGHNGERVGGKAMTITVQHLHWKGSTAHVLESDQNGEIVLGKLPFVEEVRVSFAQTYKGANSWKWELPNLRTYAPRMVNCSTNEEIRVPLPAAFSNYVDEWLAAGLVSLCRVSDPTAAVDEPVLEQLGSDVPLSCMRNANGQVVGVSFRLGRVGNYILLVRPLSTRFPVTVCKVKRASGSGELLIQQKKTLLATPSRPLTILGFGVEQSPTDRKATLCIQLDQANSASTHVWIVLKQSLAQTEGKLSCIMKADGLNTRGDNLAFEITVLENEFLKKRKFSDEYTYILQRRAFLKANPSSLTLLGFSSFPKPTLIQTPHIVDETDMEELVMRAGEKVAGFKTSDGRVMSRNRMSRIGQVGGGGWTANSAAASSISFLAKSSAALACSHVDGDGVARLCLSDLALFSESENASLELVILAFDKNNGQVTSLESQINTVSATNENSLLPTRDVRLAEDESLDSGVPSMQLQRHEVLPAGRRRTLPRSFSSKYAVYETLHSAMDLWATLCSDTQTPDLVDKLKNWSSMKPNTKIAFYFKNACDDLNFFVYRKDREFFNEYVKAYVSAKLCPSMVDLYVLEDVATMTQRYAHPGVFQKLSVIEKLLVAERADSMKTTRAICQHVVDVIDGACAADSSFGHELMRVFDTVLSQGAVKPEPTALNEVAYGMAVEEQEEMDFSDGGLMFSFESVQAAPMARSVAFGASMMSMAAPMSQSSAPFGASGARTKTAALLTKSKKAISRPQSESVSSDEESDDDDDSDFGVQSLSSDDDVTDGEGAIEAEGGDEKRARKLEATKRRAKPYVLAGKVRRVQEKRFFSVQKPALDGRNLFWRDYANHLMAQHSFIADKNSKSSLFLSSHFPEALRSFTEGIFALSVLDLANDEPTPTTARLLAGGHRVQLDAATDVVLYHQGIGAGEVAEKPNSILILKQRLVSHADLSSTSSRDFAEIRPAREFLVNRIYSCVVSVSNIGSTRLTNVNLLRQIPRGAIPLMSDGFYTKNEVIEIAPHDTQTYSCNFYFPEVGSFTQYPAHASLDGKIVAWASADDEFTRPITVVLKATTVDLTSWNDVAARGTLDDVIRFMTSKPSVMSLDLNALAWRCQEKAFYEGLMEYLRGRWVFVDSIWKYAFVHNDTRGIQEITSAKDEFLRSLGAGIHTSIVQLGEIYHQERFDASFSFDHTEFGPLLSRRVHRVAGKVESSTSSMFGQTNTEVTATSDEPARVLHKKAREYYRTLCHVLSLQSTLTTNQLLVVTYFLILFHRIADALKVFERIKTLQSSEMRDTNEFAIAADYIDAYLDFFRQHPMDQGTARFPVARRHVDRYSNLANERWHLRFSRLHEVLDEHDELQAAAASSHTHSTSSAASDAAATKQTLQHVPDDHEVRLKADVKGDEIHFTSQHLGACEVSFYRIDVELMFSTEPFDSFSASAASKSSLLLIQPWQQIRVELAGDATTASSGASPLVTTIFRLPSDLAASPMLLRIREVESTRTVSTVAAPIDFTRSYFNSQLQVVISKQAGFVQVLHNGLPVSSCYVKVYVKTSNGSGTTTTRGAGKPQFYKDGYTDVIGKFDYAAINGDLLTRVEKFSLLVSHPTLGTTVEQVLPPVLAVTSSEFKDREAREALWF